MPYKTCKKCGFANFTPKIKACCVCGSNDMIECLSINDKLINKISELECFAMDVARNVGCSHRKDCLHCSALKLIPKETP